MYTRDTSTHERKNVGTVDRKLPSFSSTLLDEIYRSIDDGSTRDIRSKDRARVVEKWIEIKKKHDDDVPKRNISSELHKKKLQDIDHNDPLFFSSGSNSSDSNSSLFSEQESTLPTITKTRLSCFLPPKPIRTSVNAEKTFIGGKAEHQQNEDVPMSTRSRASKLYAHLKKMKQPISPGMKLTTLINSILPNSKSKRGDDERKRSKATCSSATSFSRSYMSHKTTKSVKIEAEEIQRRPMNHKANELRNEKTKHGLKTEFLKAKYAGEARLAEDEASEYCSEDDLFEIDHLKPRSGGNGELPVYETTSNNRVTRGLKL